MFSVLDLFNFEMHCNQNKTKTTTNILNCIICLEKCDQNYVGCEFLNNLEIDHFEEAPGDNFSGDVVNHQTISQSPRILHTLIYPHTVFLPCMINFNK